MAELKIKHRVMREWINSLDVFGCAKFWCSYPLSPDEREDVLQWLELIRRQISRDDFLEGRPTETGKDSQ